MSSNASLTYISGLSGWSGSEMVTPMGASSIACVRRSRVSSRSLRSVMSFWTATYAVTSPLSVIGAIVWAA